MSWTLYVGSRFDRHPAPGAVVVPIDPDDEPTIRIQREPNAVTIARPPSRSVEELEQELALHAEAGQ